MPPDHARFLQQLAAEGLTLAALRQIHSANVYQVSVVAGGELRYHLAGESPDSSASANPPSAVTGGSSGVANRPSLITHRAASIGGSGPPGDALLTAHPGVLLSIRTADCMPILLVDPRRRAVAAIHAGWRGALERIVEKTVGELQRVFGSCPADLVAAVGPAIHACCYKVGEEVIEAFGRRFPRNEGFFHEPPETAAAAELRHRPVTVTQASRGRGKARTLHLDLVAVARQQLLTAGLGQSNIGVSEHCTACRTDLFFSYRREGTSTGRMMAVIGIKA